MANPKIATADLDSLINVIGLSPKDPLDTFVGMFLLSPKATGLMPVLTSHLQKYGSTCLPGHSSHPSSSTLEQLVLRSPA